MLFPGEAATVLYMIERQLEMWSRAFEGYQKFIWKDDEVDKKKET